MSIDKVRRACTLNAWLNLPNDGQCKATDEVRKDILDQACNFVAWAARDDLVILRTPQGRIMMSTEEFDDIKIVLFDWLDDHLVDRVQFWMPANAIAGLGKKIVCSKDKRVPFGEIFDYDGSFWGK